MIVPHRNCYKDLNALVLLGGPSINNYIHKLIDLKKDKFITFIEPRSISKKLLKYKFEPDYVICPFSTKLKDNNFQDWILRSFLSGIDIKKFIKFKYHDEVNYFKKNFNKYFELWKPDRGTHKKFKIKTDIYFKNSPFDNLKYFKKSKIFLNQIDYAQNFVNLKLSNDIINIEFEERFKEFDINEYYNVKNQNNKLVFANTNFLNTQAISHFSLLNYLGFKKVFFLGMDMNFYGNFEHCNLDIFRSKMHLNMFIFFVRKSLNGNFKLNFPFYLRPKEEFETLKKVLKKNNQFYRVVSEKEKFNINMKSIDEYDFFKYYNN